MRRFILLLVLGASAVWVAVALATPSQGQTSSILSLGSLQGNVPYDTGLATTASGITWNGRDYSADQLPEFLKTLRLAGVTNLGEWLQLHPAVSARFGMMPVGLLQSPEVVTQQSTFAPGAYSGWHTHPGYLTGTVVSGEIVRYSTDCTTQTFDAGQTFYETSAHSYTVKNLGTVPAVVIVTFVVPGGTPKTGLRTEAAQPSTCTQ